MTDPIPHWYTTKEMCPSNKWVNVCCSCHGRLKTWNATWNHLEVVWRSTGPCFPNPKNNEVLHKINDGKDAALFSAESSELWRFHSSPHLLSSSDKNYCSITLLSNKILQSSSPSFLVQRRWLQRVRTARAALLQDGRWQQTIWQYMTTMPATPLVQVFSP